MKYNDCITAIRTCMACNIPPFLWGSPGVGKTAMMHRIAREENCDLIIKIASGMDPAGTEGFPGVDGGWHYPNWLPMEDKPGFIFLDEVNTALPAVLAPLLQFVQTGVMGEYRLPPRYKIVLAGNYESDRTFVNRLGTAFSNRCTHIDLDPDFVSWMEDFGNNNLCEQVMAYLLRYKEDLYQFDPKSGDKCFPTLRTWDHANRIWKQNIPLHIKEDMLNGTIGKGTAAKFISFTRIWDKLPDLDEMLKNPAKYPAPDVKDVGVLYATVGSMIYRVDRKTAIGFTQYISKFPMEFQAMFYKDGCRKYTPLLETPLASKWIVDNQDNFTW